MSCESLEADGTVDASYEEELISCVEKYGPYIVIMPGVAMPHSQENAQGVKKTAIGFMKLEQAVSFQEGDHEKDARLFFTLASCDPDAHMENMARLSGMLMKKEVVKALEEAKTPEDLLRIQEEFLD